MDGTEMTRIVEAGVPQGSVLGPLLWNLTFDKILKAKTENGCRLMVRGRHPHSGVGEVGRNSEEKSYTTDSAHDSIVVFTPNKRIPPEIEITVDGEIVKSKRTIKYLGVIVDDKLTFTEHIDYVENKINKVMRSLWKLMSNLSWPTEKKRQLYANVLSSIILYAAPVWAHKASKKEKIQDTLRRLHRSISQRVIAAYKTTSGDAAAILARIPPYHMTMEKYLQEKSKAGARTREAVLPIWETWINRRHGNISFKLTQLFTGHGVFYAFLKRIGKASSDICPHCDTQDRDTAEHTLMECEAWKEYRMELLNKIKLTRNELTLGSLIKQMAKDKQDWLAAHDFAEKVFLEKEEKERQLEAEADSLPSSPEQSRTESD
ncbi:uncharacterized protein LOC105253993 [Camponotus floridanus]|uniref:uncharacterized protein LOC105253993 n=1 Tax=Camponotus floridanus TaxID=104421 RepID=UPI00059ED38A|nr:uncharacterized protein LOC105253993 [Camponotus floridanus]